MRLRTVAAAALGSFVLFTISAQAREPVPLSLANGEEAIHRYVKTETKRIERVFKTTATPTLKPCRRSRSGIEGKPVAVVWCPISWHYSPAILDGGEIGADHTRVLAIRSPFGCLRVKEAPFLFEDCLWLSR